MSKEDDYIPVSALTYHSGLTQISVSMEATDLEYDEFMELVEALIGASGYSQHEIDSYILDWAADIRSKREN